MFYINILITYFDANKTNSFHLTRCISRIREIGEKRRRARAQNRALVRATNSLMHNKSTMENACDSNNINKTETDN